MLLCEELWLCNVAPNGGLHDSGQGILTGVEGALVADLVLRGRVRATADEWEVLDTSPTGDDLLDQALSAVEGLAEHISNAADAVRLLGAARALPIISQRAVEAGHLTVSKEGRVFKKERRELTPTGEEPRRRVRAALLDPSGAPEPPTTALIALLLAVGIVEKQVPDEARRAARERAAALAEGDPVARAVIEGIRRARAQVGLAVN